MTLLDIRAYLKEDAAKCRFNAVEYLAALNRLNTVEDAHLLLHESLRLLQNACHPNDYDSAVDVEKQILRLQAALNGETK